MKKPEILAPVGNTEAFYAAIEAGTNAVYLGLDNFNARKRASNFSYTDLPNLLEEAHKHNVKVYVTLNTVIKNDEISELIEILTFFKKVKPDAVIIQDWGVYYLMKKYFPTIPIHASTQVAIHNSSGAIFVQKKGFERLIPARECTMQEIKDITEKSNIDIEVFIHGALCYSFSGMCHFSSYLGGHGANRGLCTQVCRREFTAETEKKYLFNLKDNIQINQIPELIDIGIESFKIEGRLKSDEYVYKVTNTYRQLIDNEITPEQAYQILQTDGGREKTEYFLASNIKGAIADHSPSGYYLNKIKEVTDDGFSFETNHNFSTNFRLRVSHQNTDKQTNLKVKEYTQDGSTVKVFTDKKYNIGDELYLIGEQIKKFPQKLPEYTKPIPKLKAWNKGKILKEIKDETRKIKYALFVRIDNLEWLRKIYFNNVDSIVMSFTENEWNELRINSGLIQKYKKKIWIEFPQYISEKKMEFYKNFASLLKAKGFRKFMLSHISQKNMLPQGSIFALNETAYAYNDAAIKFYRQENASLITYPIETDWENLKNYSYKAGILPIYFYPRLFVSRMPITELKSDELTDDTGKKYKKVVRDGVTTIVPQNPVSFLQYTKELKKNGFARFMIDLSYEKPSSNRFNTIIKRYLASEQIQPSENFNFKKGLK